MGIRKGLVYVFRKKQRKELIFDIVLSVKRKRYNCQLGGGVQAEEVSKDFRTTSLKWLKSRPLHIRIIRFRQFVYKILDQSSFFDKKKVSTKGAMLSIMSTKMFSKTPRLAKPRQKSCFSKTILTDKIKSLDISLALRLK